MPKKKIAEKEPVSVNETAVAAQPAKGTVSKARAPRASAKAVTHKHKKATMAPTAVEPVAAEVVAHVAEPTYEEVSKLAYSYWAARGYQGGSQEEDWFRAMNELRNR